MKLTPNFTFYEMTATRHRRLQAENRRSAEEYRIALKATAEMLQVIRDHYNRPVVVHSAFRSAALNKAIGGAARSQHLTGQAADFHVDGVPLREVFDWIRSESGIAFGQLILEGPSGHPTWIHLSLGPPWRSTRRSGQVLTWSPTLGYRMLP